MGDSEAKAQKDKVASTEELTNKQAELEEQIIVINETLDLSKQ